MTSFGPPLKLKLKCNTMRQHHRWATTWIRWWCKDKTSCHIRILCSNSSFRPWTSISHIKWTTSTIAWLIPTHRREQCKWIRECRCLCRLQFRRRLCYHEMFPGHQSQTIGSESMKQRRRWVQWLRNVRSILDSNYCFRHSRQATYRWAIGCVKSLIKLARRRPTPKSARNAKKVCWTNFDFAIFCWCSMRLKSFARQPFSLLLY